VAVRAVSNSRQKLVETAIGDSGTNAMIFLAGKKTVKFRTFAAEKADRELYRKLSGQERLNILLEMTKEATD
jgi:hypothetical protein